MIIGVDLRAELEVETDISLASISMFNTAIDVSILADYIGNDLEFVRHLLNRTMSLNYGWLTSSILYGEHQLSYYWTDRKAEYMQTKLFFSSYFITLDNPSKDSTKVISISAD